MKIFAPIRGPKTEPSSAVDTAIRQLARFHREEDGVFVAFSLFVMLIILSVAGIGVDTMRFEMERTRLQNTIDRAVLAAADLDQTLTPKAVVEDYFVEAGITNVVPVVDPKTGVGYKSVNAKASKVIKTQFMHMSGVDTLTIPAEATAEERVPKVEISLVVDISGSMKDNSRMVNLKAAGETFVNAVINSSTTNRVSVNFIPYSEHVNVGPEIMDELNVNQVHNYSHCIEFDNSDFGYASLNKSKSYQQMQHFQWNTYSIESGNTQNTRYDTVCPRYSYERVTAMSQNASALINQIKSLKPRAGTQIFLGMKWGAAMLDPSFQTINAKLATLSKADNNFNTRPAAYADSKTPKTIVLMTTARIPPPSASIARSMRTRATTRTGTAITSITTCSDTSTPASAPIGTGRSIRRPRATICSKTSAMRPRKRASLSGRSVSRPPNMVKNRCANVPLRPPTTSMWKACRSRMLSSPSPARLTS